jgi:hypothetical protein
VTLPTVSDRETAAQLIREAHQVCPYSNATRGNIDVTLQLQGESLCLATQPRSGAALSLFGNPGPDTDDNGEDPSQEQG